MQKINFINGTLIDTITGQGTKTNLLIENGLLKGMGYLPDESDADTTVIDIKGQIVLPNCVDVYPLIDFDAPAHLSLKTLKLLSPQVQAQLMPQIATGFFQFATSGEPQPLTQFIQDAITILHCIHQVPIGDDLKLISTNPRKQFGIKRDGIALTKKPNFAVISLTADTSSARVTYLVQEGDIMKS